MGLQQNLYDSKPKGSSKKFELQEYESTNDRITVFFSARVCSVSTVQYKTSKIKKVTVDLVDTSLHNM